MPNLRGPKKGPNAKRKARSKGGPKGPKGPNAKRTVHLPGTVWKKSNTSPTGKNSPYGAKNKAGETRYFKTPYAAKRFASE